MAALTARKVAFETAIRSGKPSADLLPEERWTSEHVRELEEAVELAKRALVLGRQNIAVNTAVYQWTLLYFLFIECCYSAVDSSYT